MGRTWSPFAVFPDVVDEDPVVPRRVLGGDPFFQRLEAAVCAEPIQGYNFGTFRLEALQPTVKAARLHLVQILSLASIQKKIFADTGQSRKHENLSAAVNEYLVARFEVRGYLVNCRSLVFESWKAPLERKSAGNISIDNQRYDR